MSNIKKMMADIGANARTASQELAFASAERKHAALIGAADAVWARRGDIINANAKDLEYGREKGLSPAMMDRLMPVSAGSKHSAKMSQQRSSASNNGMFTLRSMISASNLSP